MFITPKLKGIEFANAMILAHLRNDAKVDKERKFAGSYRMYRLFITEKGEFELQVPDDIEKEELLSLTQ